MDAKKPEQPSEATSAMGSSSSLSQETPTPSPPEPRNPLLPPPPPDSKKFTVFLSLVGTLIHTTDQMPQNFDYVMFDGPPMIYIQKRPFLDELLHHLGERFEVVLFVCESEDYASNIVDKLDTNSVISHRLYQDSCKLMTDDSFTKDLSVTGRDLTKVLIVDDNPNNFSLQPENGIRIRRFSGDLEDTELRKLIKFFRCIKDHHTDLTEAIKDFAPSRWRNFNSDDDDSSFSSNDLDDLD